eukprot:5782402-Pyramimonas_sp.AAC.1
MTSVVGGVESGDEQLQIVRVRIFVRFGRGSLAQGTSIRKATQCPRGSLVKNLKFFSDLEGQR